MAKPTLTKQAPTTTAPVATTHAVVVAAPATHPLQVVYTLAGGKAYNVRPNTAFDNTRSWQTLVAFMQASGGQATLAQLQAHLKAQHNHANFASYVVKRGYIAPAQVATTA